MTTKLPFGGRGSPAPAAIETLGKLRAEEGREPVVVLLRDADERVRRAAAGAAGQLGVRQAIEPLLKLTADPDLTIRLASLDSLRLLREPRVVPIAVAALRDHQLEMKALECLSDLGSPEQSAAVAELARRNPSAAVLTAAIRLLSDWRNRDTTSPEKRQELDRLVAEIHGSTGTLVRWDAIGPVKVDAVPRIIERFGQSGGDDGNQRQFAAGIEARVTLAPKDSTGDGLWFAYADVEVAEITPVEFLASGSGDLQVWLNGQSIYKREQARNFQIDSDRFAAAFRKGTNRLLVHVGPSASAIEFHLRFRRKSATAEHERLTSGGPLPAAAVRFAAVKLFFDKEKSLCLKCHQLGDQGERIGPELTGVGGRFARIYIVESILEPSRTIAPSFGTLVVTLNNGKVLTGVKVAETATMLTLADNQGTRHTLVKADVEKQQPSPLSTMPDGLEKRFTEDEFIDLIAFLASQKEGRAP